MPFKVADILTANNESRYQAAAYCLSVATNFPEKAEEYNEYARMLLRSK